MDGRTSWPPFWLLANLVTILRLFPGRLTSALRSQPRYGGGPAWAQPDTGTFGANSPAVNKVTNGVCGVQYCRKMSGRRLGICVLMREHSSVDRKKSTIYQE